MKKDSLVSLVDALLAPQGFKRKGVRWMSDNGVLVKHVDIQKSAFANTFYINYGFSLKSVPLNGLEMHLYLRLSSPDSDESRRIDSILDLDSDIPDVERGSKLMDVFSDQVLLQLKQINNEDDFLAELKKCPHLNNISILVRNHFGL